MTKHNQKLQRFHRVAVFLLAVGCKVAWAETKQEHVHQVGQSAIPNGAEIMFETADLHLLTAIHRWFGAQLSEHGSDATSE
jgi:hypothetical protein